MTTMKAVRIHANGGPEVLIYEDIPRPAPAPDEALVRIHAAAVNPIDWKIRDGFLRDRLGYSMPHIPGSDFAGVIEEVGADFTALQPGDEVYGHIALNRKGSCAEYAAVQAIEVARKPASLDFAQAAAVPVVAHTAWQAMFDLAKLTAGQRILIHAAAGGVGSMAVQLAKAFGAYVIGTASPRNHAFLREIGADEVIDYNSTRFEDVVREPDVIFDNVGGDTLERSYAVVKKGGVLVSAVSPLPKAKLAEYGLTGGMVHATPNAQQLDEVTALIEAGKIKPYVETILPLDQIARAHEMSQTGHTRGKIVLQVR